MSKSHLDAYLAPGSLMPPLLVLTEQVVNGLGEFLRTQPRVVNATKIVSAFPYLQDPAFTWVDLGQSTILVSSTIEEVTSAWSASLD